MGICGSHAHQFTRDTGIYKNVTGKNNGFFGKRYLRLVNFACKLLRREQPVSMFLIKGREKPRPICDVCRCKGAEGEPQSHDKLHLCKNCVRKIERGEGEIDLRAVLLRKQAV